METIILGYIAVTAPSSHDTQNQRATETPCACYDDPIAALKFCCTLGVSSGIMEGKDGEGELLCKDSVWLGGGRVEEVMLGLSLKLYRVGW